MQPVVIRFGRLGDMLLLAPLLQWLHRGYGVPCVVLGTGPWTGALYAGNPDVAAVLQVTDRHRPLVFSPARWRMVSALRGMRDAAVHVCEVEPRALAKIRRMLALAGVRRARCTFLTDTPVRAGEHWVDRLLRGCGSPPRACTTAWQRPSLPAVAAPRLFLRDVDREDCAAWLAARGWHGEPLWLVQPCNKRSVRRNTLRAVSDDTKAWPLQRWAEAVRVLRADFPGARIMLCGAPPEAAVLDAIAADAGIANVDVGARELSVRRLMALAERAQGMVSVDTGPAHVAAAMGCPLVVLFGAGSPRVWCPRSPTGSAVVALGGPPGRHRADAVSLGEVIAAWRGLMPGHAQRVRGT